MPRTKRKKGIAWVMLIIAASSFAAYYFWHRFEEEQHAKFAIYPAFGIGLPLGYAIHGIDVSSYQQYIYWPAVKTMQAQNVKIGFAFIKASEGLNDADKMFRRNWLQAKQAGIARGAYHFFLATKKGKLQAQNFIKNVRLEPGDLPPVLDVEGLYGVQPDVMRREVHEWLQTVETAFKVKPVIYTYADFYEKYLGNGFNDYPLWVAHYFGEGRPRINRDWIFWQHSDGGKVNGITTHVDFNVFAGDTAQFRNLLVK